LNCRSGEIKRIESAGGRERTSEREKRERERRVAPDEEEE